MSINKILRFEIFKRDNFQCIYCGKKPPKIKLELDHIKPSSKGGTDDVNNLLTSCFDCNRGKRNNRLNKISKKLIEKIKKLNLKKFKEKKELLAFTNPITIKTNSLLTIKETSKILNVTRMTIYRWIKRGKIRSVSFGSVNYILRQDVEKIRKEI